jgi:hypothetical protein
MKLAIIVYIVSMSIQLALTVMVLARRLKKPKSMAFYLYSVSDPGDMNPVGWGKYNTLIEAQAAQKTLQLEPYEILQICIVARSKELAPELL